MAGLLNADELAWMTTTIASAFDVSLPLYRKTTASDGYGHKTETWVSQGNVSVNIFKPTATQLQSFASIIGTQRALMIRFASTTDIREGDRIVYQSSNWLVQNILNAESYTFMNDALITTIN